MTGHEPGLAFRGGDDGLALVRRLVAAVAQAGIGWVALEGADGQAPAIAALLTEAGLTVREVRRDFTGMERVVVAAR
jgi:methylase of polypeptide subunit release factors